MLGEKQDAIGEGVLKNPSCIVHNSRRNIIVADASKSDIFVFDLEGNFLHSMKLTVPRELENELTGCNRLAVGSGDRTYAAGPYSRNILVFSADCRFEKLLPLGSEKHDSISSLLVHNGSLYVAHRDCIRLYQLTP